MKTIRKIIPITNKAIKKYIEYCSCRIAFVLLFDSCTLIALMLTLKKVESFFFVTGSMFGGGSLIFDCSSGIVIGGADMLIVVGLLDTKS